MKQEIKELKAELSGIMKSKQPERVKREAHYLHYKLGEGHPEDVMVARNYLDYVVYGGEHHG